MNNAGKGSPVSTARPASSPERAPAWDGAALENPHAQPDKAARVEAMFDAIAPTYEKVNAVASLGQDARWRRVAVDAADVRPSDIALDICCGTGDMIRTFAAHTPPPARILGLDFSRQMLAGGCYDRLGVPLQLLRGDALRLPLADASVDVISCAFGVRNFQDLADGLREMRRVLRPGGRLVVLEFAAPDNPLVRWGHQLYCNVLLPRIGRWISRDRTGAYTYLPRSINTFSRCGEMVRQIEQAGFSQVTTRKLNLGSVVVYRGVR